MVKTLKYWIQRSITHYKRKGLLDTVNYLLINGPYKRIKNYSNYFLKNKKYPQNVIFLASLPKSGSTWVANMFNGLDGFDQFAPLKWNTSIQKEWEDTRWDLYDGFFDEFDKKLAVIRGHTWPHLYNIEILQKSGLKYFITVRDPRDKLISEYWHSRNYPKQWKRELTEHKNISEYITYVFESGDFEKQTIDWIRAWLDFSENKKICLIKYEDLLTDTYLTMKKALLFLGFECDDIKLKNIIDENKFVKVTGREKGIEDSTSFVRKGVAGEWKEIFTEKQKRMFCDIGEDVIRRMGYQPTL